jgi:hypothetical protein
MTNMTYEELRQLLVSAKPDIVGREFMILRSLCALVNRDPDVHATHSLVLRALEYRDRFGGLATMLDSLVRELGLFPYLDPSMLSVSDLFAYEFHRPEEIEDIVFHRVQAEVYHELMSGSSVILSAPTSFGKSLVIDAMIASRKHRDVAVVLPTIALIDETRRRLTARFRASHKLLTHPSQTRGDRNIYIITQERAPSFDDLEHVTLYIIDGNMLPCTLLTSSTS